MVFKARASRWLSISYTLAFYVLSPIILFYTFVHALRARDRRFLRERLGWYQSRSGPKPLWIHAASVGEVIAAEPLIQNLNRRFPAVRIVLSTATPTGAKVAALRLPPGTTHLYCPIDFPGMVRRFLTTLEPRCALIMETELWLNLYRACQTRGVCVVLVNGRLSSRTLNAGSWLRRVHGAALARVDAVLARSAADREAFITLGASPDRVKVIGNIKFAASSKPPDQPWRPPTPRPYVLAASTHDNEEQRFLRLWQARDRNDYLLVIAPRHPARVKSILKQLTALDRRVAVRSKNGVLTDQTSVYIVDTLGELTAFMSGAEVVFVGGSLIPHGGQNILEPARLGKPILFGPHMDNFIDEARILLENEAAIQVASDAALEACLTRLLESPTERDELGRRSKAVIDKYHDVAERYVDEIATLCELS